MVCQNIEHKNRKLLVCPPMCPLGLQLICSFLKENKVPNMGKHRAKLKSVGWPLGELIGCPRLGLKNDPKSGQPISSPVANLLTFILLLAAAKMRISKRWTTYELSKRQKGGQTNNSPAYVYACMHLCISIYIYVLQS